MICEMRKDVMDLVGGLVNVKRGDTERNKVRHTTAHLKLICWLLRSFFLELSTGTMLSWSIDARCNKRGCSEKSWRDTPFFPPTKEEATARAKFACCMHLLLFALAASTISGLHQGPLAPSDPAYYSIDCCCCR